MTRFFWFGIVGLLLSASSGCGGSEVEIGTVSGVVTLDGKPLRGVCVTFQPTGYPPSYGVTDRNGKYVLKYKTDEPGAVVGQHEVYVGELLADEVDEFLEEIGGRPSRVPEKIRGQVIQTVEVTSDHNEVNLTLTSEPR